MALTVLTPAQTPTGTFRLTTLAAVMAEVKLDDQVIFLERLIDESSAAIARYCGCIFAQQQYLETIPLGGQGPYLTLGYRQGTRPLVAVQGITHDLQAFTGWRVDSWEAAILHHYAGWGARYWGGWGCGSPLCTGTWDVTFAAGYILPEQLNPFDASGPRLPLDIERSCIECCKIWFSERIVGERVQSRNLGDQTISYGIQSFRRGIPALSQDLLRNWRRLRVA